MSSEILWSSIVGSQLVVMTDHPSNHFLGDPHIVFLDLETYIWSTVTMNNQGPPISKGLITVDSRLFVLSYENVSDETNYVQWVELSLKKSLSLQETCVASLGNLLISCDRSDDEQAKEYEQIFESFQRLPEPLCQQIVNFVIDQELLQGWHLLLFPQLQELRLCGVEIDPQYLNRLSHLQLLQIDGDSISLLTFRSVYR